MSTHQVDRWIAELKAAGWTAVKQHLWRDPAGGLHLGPAGAWRRMKGLGDLKSRADVESGRQRIIDRALANRAEIEQIFLDCAYWNNSRRRADEDPIDPDPDGQLRRIADALDVMLEKEASR